MNKVMLLITLLVLLSSSVFCQEKKQRISFYNGDKLAVSFLTNKKIYSELQVESTNLEIQDARFSALLKNDIDFKEMVISWGVGYSYCDAQDSYFAVPIEVRKDNLLNKNISLGIGVEVGSDFGEKVLLKPLLGISINF